VVLEDLESKNGTYADDRAVTKPTTIVDGCQVRIGSLLFTFRLARSLGSTETLSSQRGPRLRP
jgi:pSer/pThr/pTyr-binding forkhead associated (FHA) protein